MPDNNEYTYPKFQYTITHSTGKFRVVEGTKGQSNSVHYGKFKNVQQVLDDFKAISMTEPSTWVARFHKHGFLILDVSYTDEDFNWFTSVEQAFEKHNRGEGIEVHEWKLITMSDRVLTKRDKREIMKLYDGSDEARLAREMEDVE